MPQKVGGGTSKDVVLFGTGSLAEVAHFYLTRDSDYHVAGVTATAPYATHDTWEGVPMVPFEEVERTFPPDRYKMFIAVGFVKLNQLRERFYHEAKRKGYQLITYLNSRAIHWNETVIGDNCFVFENVNIQPFVNIGNDVIIWSSNHIGHHVAIGDHCFITSHVVISGNVKIGSHCFLGVNATIRDGITIAPRCVIGAGALMMHDTKEGEVYTGKRAELFPRDSSRMF